MVRIVIPFAYHAPVRRVVSFFVRRIVVEGSSMLPTYHEGTELLAVRRWRPVRVGEVVVAVDPRDPQRFLLKRCVARQGRLLDLRGDNPVFSTDSRTFGLVPSRHIRYLVRAPLQRS